MRQAPNIQTQLWLRFSFELEIERESAEHESLRRMFLLDALDELTGLDGHLDAEVRSRMSQWLNQHDRYTPVEARIYEILLFNADDQDSEADHENRLARYLDFLEDGPGYVTANEPRVLGALNHARAQSAMLKWLAAKSGQSSSLVASLTGDDGRVREFRRLELLLHVMQVICPDVFWDESGRSWSVRTYVTAGAAISDYPYFEHGNIEYKMQQGLISAAEAADLARLATMRRIFDRPEGSELNNAAEAQDALASVLEPHGLLDTLLTLREAVLRLRRGPADG